ncbi:TPA: DUF551 domain-containing protein [Serratia marcescens]
MTRTLTTEQLRARAESLGLDFFIEKRAGIWVKEWNTGACVTANAQEVEMWLLLANREAQPVAWRHDDGPFAGIAITRAKSVADSWIAKGWTVTPLYTAPPAPAVPESIITAPIEAMRCGPAASYVLGWNACRAAMLAQPVSGGYKLPEGWIVCSERMPDADGAYWCWFGKEKPSVIQQRVCIWNDRNHEWCDSAVTHWMPLPVAPEGGNG